MLECAPSLNNCGSRQIYQVDLSADVADVNPVLPNRGRPTYHLAPDGVHLGYTMVAGRDDHDGVDASEGLDRLRRRESASCRSAGVTGASDTSVQDWSNAGQMYELKGFTDGGAAVLIAGEPDEGHFDTLKLNPITSFLSVGYRF